MSNWYFFAKAIHIIGFVSWFAGLFYLVRIYIYHAEASEKKSDEEKKILIPQYEIMADRLYKIIANPAMIITWIGGISMITMGYLGKGPNYMTIQESFLQEGWLHIKLGFVILLTGYHHYARALFKKLKNGTNTMSSQQLRGFNEFPTMFLAAIVLLAVYKNMENFGYAFLGLFAFGFALFMGIRIYKRNREKSEAS